MALALFWKNIRTEESTPYISYLCLLATIPLLFEVNKGYDYNKSTWNLIFFMQAFNGIVFFTVYDLVASYPTHLEKIINGLVFFVLFIGLLALQGKLLSTLVLAVDGATRLVGAESSERTCAKETSLTDFHPVIQIA